MTPLAHRIVKDMTKPVNRRSFRDDGLIAHFREEFHCFEVSQVLTLARDLKREMLEAAFPSMAWSFLPAERTWLEWKEQHGGRVGIMLVKRGDFAEVYVASTTPQGVSPSDFCGARVGEMALCDALTKVDPSLGWEKIETAIFRGLHPAAKKTGPSTPETIMWEVYPLLLLINTPRVIGRQTHDPHRGMARHILANRKTLGIFPLQAWTEITLATATIDVSNERPQSSRLSGEMPLHWTRAHKKRVHGIWTLISDYWSGDGSLGIRQSRYKLVPEQRD